MEIFERRNKLERVVGIAWSLKKKKILPVTIRTYADSDREYFDHFEAEISAFKTTVEDGCINTLSDTFHPRDIRDYETLANGKNKIMDAIISFYPDDIMDGILFPRPGRYREEDYERFNRNIKKIEAVFEQIGKSTVELLKKGECLVDRDHAGVWGAQKFLAGLLKNHAIADDREGEVLKPLPQRMENLIDKLYLIDDLFGANRITNMDDIAKFVRGADTYENRHVDALGPFFPLEFVAVASSYRESMVKISKIRSDRERLVAKFAEACASIEASRLETYYLPILLGMRERMGLQKGGFIDDLIRKKVVSRKTRVRGILYVEGVNGDEAISYDSTLGEMLDRPVPEITHLGWKDESENVGSSRLAPVKWGRPMKFVSGGNAFPVEPKRQFGQPKVTPKVVAKAVAPTPRERKTVKFSPL